MSPCASRCLPVPPHRLDLAARGGGVLLAHAALPQATAEALGVRSLRHAHEAEAQLTSALPCPSPAELRERLGLAAQVRSIPGEAASSDTAMPAITKNMCGAGNKPRTGSRMRFGSVIVVLN